MSDKSGPHRGETPASGGRWARRLLVGLVLSILPWAGMLGVARAETQVDVTISMYKYVQVADREPYERILESFADGVYESSNGDVRIRNIRIFPDRHHASSADVIWEANGWPCANPSGRGHPGLNIKMFDVFSPSNFITTDHVGGGYTLAHEWGHYYFGLYDEYRGSKTSATWPSTPLKWDTPVQNSMMNSQWEARGGDFTWLNFSASGNAKAATAQWRVFGASGWDTLARDLSADPQDATRTAMPKRDYYPTLASVAPTSTNLPRIDLPGTARDDLDVTWMEASQTVQIVLDHSGSMASSDKLVSAKLAAGMLVDVVETGTVVGVIAFDDNITVMQPLTPITGQASRDAIKSAINTITVGNFTAIGDAAQKALDDLVAYGGPTDQSVFLLSDGIQTAGVIHPLDVIADYRSHHVSMYTFAYGTEADQDTLRQMAEKTGGAYYFAPATVTDIVSSFQSASDWASSSQGLVSDSLALGAGAVIERGFDVDPSLGGLYLAVTQAGTLGEVTVQAIAPGGAVSSPTSSTVVGGSVQHVISIDDPASGRWRLRLTSASASARAITYYFSGSAGGSATYGLAVEAGPSLVKYPAPIVFTATLKKGLPIAGARVAAILEDPDGVTSTVTFRDDGLAGDAMAGDGTYTVLLNYATNGVYTVRVTADNEPGTAKLTYSGLLLAASPPPPGGSASTPADVPILEDFTRFAQAQVTVEGVKSDDHGNTPGAATLVQADNGERDGKIDYLADPDCFRVPVPAGASELVFRVTDLGLGMDPRLTIRDSSGTSVITSATLAGATSGLGYLCLRVPTGGQSHLYAEVRHTSLTALGGIYRFSAGSALRSETLPTPTTITIKTAATTTTIGKTVPLSGAVTPMGMIGVNIVVYVMKPGKTYWTYSSNRTVYSLGGSPAWLYKYYFKPGMARGSYKFKARAPAPGFASSNGFATSESPTTVTIRVR